MDDRVGRVSVARWPQALQAQLAARPQATVRFQTGISGMLDPHSHEAHVDNLLEDQYNHMEQSYETHRWASDAHRQRPRRKTSRPKEPPAWMRLSGEGGYTSAFNSMRSQRAADQAQRGASQRQPAPPFRPLTPSPYERSTSTHGRTTPTPPRRAVSAGSGAAAARQARAAGRKSPARSDREVPRPGAARRRGASPGPATTPGGARDRDRTGAGAAASGATTTLHSQQLHLAQTHTLRPAHAQRPSSLQRDPPRGSTVDHVGSSREGQSPPSAPPSPRAHPPPDPAMPAAPNGEAKGRALPPCFDLNAWRQAVLGRDPGATYHLADGGGSGSNGSAGGGGTGRARAGDASEAPPGMLVLGAHTGTASQPRAGLEKMKRRSVALLRRSRELLLQTVLSVGGAECGDGGCGDGGCGGGGCGGGGSGRVPERTATGPDPERAARFPHRGHGGGDGAASPGVGSLRGYGDGGKVDQRLSGMGGVSSAGTASAGQASLGTSGAVTQGGAAAALGIIPADWWLEGPPLEALRSDFPAWVSAIRGMMGDLNDAMAQIRCRLASFRGGLDDGAPAAASEVSPRPSGPPDASARASLMAQQAALARQRKSLAVCLRRMTAIMAASDRMSPFDGDDEDEEQDGEEVGEEGGAGGGGGWMSGAARSIATAASPRAAR
ncbi:hypothetical protein GPECTOR_19g362 [Gonium pectorale]|uniref:Uncharacterized protein n=1 Tax=Gonium pectorale TaxID=33097 RepID=A0A150GJE3_GONPE|nr:hypothetical protein GPECTOR_19g362 [Gonium pectorale]|eukprot:KXZ49911.1 hypothetical protein GPECTOR_19g362 [Gonium pectorale]